MVLANQVHLCRVLRRAVHHKIPLGRVQAARIAVSHHRRPSRQPCRLRRPLCRTAEHLAAVRLLDHPGLGSNKPSVLMDQLIALKPPEMLAMWSSRKTTRTARSRAAVQRRIGDVRRRRPSAVPVPSPQRPPRFFTFPAEGKHSTVADPGCLSRIRLFSIPDPGSAKNLSIFTQQKWFLSSKNMIRVVNPGSGC